MENIQCYANIHVQEVRKRPWTILAIVQFSQQIPLLLHAVTLQARVSLGMVEKSVENEEWKKKKYALLVYCFLWQTRNKFLKSKERERERNEIKEQVGLGVFFWD